MQGDPAGLPLWGQWLPLGGEIEAEDGYGRRRVLSLCPYVPLRVVLFLWFCHMHLFCSLFSLKYSSYTEHIKQSLMNNYKQILT